MVQKSLWNTTHNNFFARDTLSLGKTKNPPDEDDQAGNTVELRGFEPLTSSLRTRRATSCAKAPRTSRPRHPKVRRKDNTRGHRATNQVTQISRPLGR